MTHEHFALEQLLPWQNVRSHDRKNVKQRVNASLIRNRCIAAWNDRRNIKGIG